MTTRISFRTALIAILAIVSVAGLIVWGQMASARISNGGGTSSAFSGSVLSVGTTSTQEIGNFDNTAKSNFTTISLTNHSVNAIFDADSVDTWNSNYWGGPTGIAFIGSKTNVPLVLGINGVGTCGIYDDNTLDTLFNCFPPANGKEMTFTNELPQGSSKVWWDHTLMNYSAQTGLNASDNFSKGSISLPFPTYSMVWWDQAIGSNAVVSNAFFVASTTESGTFGTTTAIALGDVATSSYSSANGVDLNGATIQLISSSTRTTALSVSKNTTNSLTRLFTVLTSGKVAVGTSSPAVELHLWNNDANTAVITGNQAAERITNSNTTDNTMGELSFSSVDSSGGAELRTSAIVGITTSHTVNSMSGALAFITRNAGTFGEAMRITATGAVGIGSSTPIANLQVTNSASNATTSLQFGKPSQNKGTCITYYDTAGTPVYGFIAAGATAFTYTATKPSGCQN